jgi:hypothetical protein
MAGKLRIAAEGLGGAGSGASIEIFSAGVGWSEAAAHGRANQRRRMGTVRPVTDITFKVTGLRSLFCRIGGPQG